MALDLLSVLYKFENSTKCNEISFDLGPVHTTPFLLVSVFVASKLSFTLLRFRTKTVRKTSVFVRSR